MVVELAVKVKPVAALPFTPPAGDQTNPSYPCADKVSRGEAMPLQLVSDAALNERTGGDTTVTVTGLVAL